MATRKFGTGRRENDTDLLDLDAEENLVDDEPEDGFEMISDEDEKPEDRRRDPLRKPF